jgi:hypothetical protein
VVIPFLPVESSFQSNLGSDDVDCASTCCNGNKCRAILSLIAGVEACGDDRTPNFDGPQSKIVQIGIRVDEEAAESDEADEEEETVSNEEEAEEEEEIRADDEETEAKDEEIEVDDSSVASATEASFPPTPTNQGESSVVTATGVSGVINRVWSGTPESDPNSGVVARIWTGKPSENPNNSGESAKDNQGDKGDNTESVGVRIQRG